MIEVRRQIAGDVRYYRNMKHRIVMTTGCFDLFHYGHVQLLETCRRLGDVVFVGMNSDESVRRLKGPNRPLNNEEERAGVLLATRYVDHIYLIEEDTPCELIRLIRPDIYVKGGDYSLQDLPEASVVTENGGKVVVAPLVQGKSTTALLNGLSAINEKLTDAAGRLPTSRLEKVKEQIEKTRMGLSPESSLEIIEQLLECRELLY